MICFNCHSIVIISSEVPEHSVLIADSVFFCMVSLMESSHWKGKKNVLIPMDVHAIVVKLGRNHWMLVVKLEFKQIQQFQIILIFFKNFIQKYVHKS